MSTYKQLNLGCFYQGCTNLNPHTWCHSSNCNTKIEVNQNGDIRCPTHPQSVLPANKWNFYCTSHQADAQFNNMSFVQRLKEADSVSMTTEDKSWTMKLMLAVLKMVG